MRYIVVSGMILGLLVCCRGVIVASEADELRERAAAMQKKASVLAEQGNQEQAERLERESVDLLEAAERLVAKSKGREKGGRPGIDTEVNRLKGRLQDLHAQEQKLQKERAPKQELAEVRAQISHIEKELQQIHGHHARRDKHRPEFHGQFEKLEVASRRIHHLRVAAENLKMAEVHDLAQKLMEQADEMERDVQAARERLAAEHHEAQKKPAEHGPDVVRELKAEIEELRAELRELRQKLEKQ